MQVFLFLFNFLVEIFTYIFLLYSQGELKVQETKMEGFENMPQAFIDLLEGKNTGKMIIKV